VYFHDTDLLDRRRRAGLRVLLGVLARVAEATHFDRLVPELEDAPAVDWADVVRDAK
jgi:hypothetical protein